MDLEQERLDMMRAAHEGRSRAVMHYQVNIDNFRAALTLLEGEMDPNLDAFARELEAALANEIAQQAREKVMLTVVERQLETTNVRPA
jgi:hypothetical protein